MTVIPAAAARSVVFVNRFYAPDHSATAQMLTDLAVALARRGWTVRVITSRALYDDPAADLPPTESIQGVAIERVAAARFGRGSLAGRLADYLFFYASALRAIRRAYGTSDVVVIKTDPPMLSVVALLARIGKSGAVVNWLQDLYPEVAAGLGVKMARGPAGTMLRRIRNWSLRRSTHNVAIGEIMARRLIAENVPADRVSVIANWTDDEEVRPLRSDDDLRVRWGYPRDWFIIGYSGNLGRAHEVDTVIAAATLLEDAPSIRFLFVGGGKLRGELERRTAEAGVTSFLFQPYQPRADLARSMASANIHWLSLVPAMEGLIVPSKLYGILAAGKPVVAVVDRGGEVSRCVSEGDFGVTVQPGDGAGLARAIRALAEDPARIERLGSNARKWLETRNSRLAMIDRWDALLDRIVRSRHEPCCNSLIGK